MTVRDVPEFQLNEEDVLLAPGVPLKVIRRCPQIAYPLHTHSFAELVVITHGSGIHHVAGQHISIGAGDIFVIRGERVHGYTDVHDLHLINVLFDAQILETSLWDLTELPGFHALFDLEPRWRGHGEVATHLHLDHLSLARVEEKIQAIEAELQERETAYQFMSVTCFLRLIGELSRWYSKASHPTARRLSRIGQALAFLEHHLEQDISMEELALTVGLSASTLNRAFRQAVGLPPKAYHMRLRLRRAALLLQTTDLNIGQVAEQCGFRDSNYFSRQFRHVMDMSPREYRRKF